MDGSELDRPKGDEMKELGRDDILGAKDILEELLEVPEWGGTVRVRGLTGRERDAYEASLVDQRGKNTKTNLHNARAKLVALAVIDSSGQRCFTESDIPALGAKSASALDRVWKKARDLSGMTDEDVEELTLGFDDAPSEPSTSV